MTFVPPPPNTPLTPEERAQLEELKARADREAWEGQEAAKAAELVIYQPLVGALVADDPVKLSVLVGVLKAALPQVIASPAASAMSVGQQLNATIQMITRLQETIADKVASLQPSPEPPAPPAPPAA